MMLRVRKRTREETVEFFVTAKGKGEMAGSDATNFEVWQDEDEDEERMKRRLMKDE